MQKIQMPPKNQMKGTKIQPPNSKLMRAEAELCVRPNPSTEVRHQPNFSPSLTVNSCHNLDKHNKKYIITKSEHSSKNTYHLRHKLIDSFNTGTSDLCVVVTIC